MGYQKGELVKPNEGRRIGDLEFAEALTLGFYVDRQTAEIFDVKTGRKLAPDFGLIWSLWDQLLHAYGFEPDGLANAEHAAQFLRATGWTE